MAYVYGETPYHRESKRWGVYGHRVTDRQHPVVRHMNTLFDVPHSRHREISREQFERAGMRALVESEEAGVHMATSPDGFRLLCLQGHPEYDSISLLKEYRREVVNFINGERPDYPPFPDHYFNKDALALLEKHREKVLSGSGTAPEFPESAIEPLIEDTWRDSARAMIGNWIGAVYQVTDVDRRKPFMDGINPDDPFGLYG
jgi:homoserine O-succinyltransferase